jgi:hypothetical protein
MLKVWTDSWRYMAHHYNPDSSPRQYRGGGITHPLIIPRIPVPRGSHYEDIGTIRSVGLTNTLPLTLRIIPPSSPQYSIPVPLLMPLSRGFLTNGLISDRGIPGL